MIVPIFIYVGAGRCHVNIGFEQADFLSLSGRLKSISTHNELQYKGCSYT